LNIFDGEPAGTGVFGVDDVEKVRVGEGIPDSEVLGLHPGVDPVVLVIAGGIAHHVGEVVLLLHVEFVLYGAEHGEQVFFELHANELFTTGKAVILRPARVVFVPSVMNCLCEEVYPSPIWRGKNRGLAESCGGNIHGMLVEVDEYIAVSVSLLQQK
jgi:hypothetical protein